MKLIIILPPAPFLLDDRAFLMLGPLQIAAVARDIAGWEVSVLDLTGHARRCPKARHDNCTENILRYVDETVPGAVAGADLVGLYGTGWLMPGTYRALAAVKSLGKDAPPTVIGGPHANTMGEKLVDDFTYICAADQGGGGGELSFLEVLRRVKTQSGGKGVVKVASRDGSEFPNDRWPYPARDLIDMDSYHYSIDGRRATHIVSSSGCPFACSFCAHWDGYRKLVSRSIPHVEGEIRQIIDRYGIRALMDYSDEVNLYGGGGQPFYDWMDMLQRAGIERWRGFFKAGRSERIMSEPMIKKMAETGCHQVCVGAESGSPLVLSKIGKGATLEDNTNFVRWCVKHGIAPKCFIQVGLPGETTDTVEETRAWLVKMAGEGLRHVDVAITTPFEGTPIREHPGKFDLTWDEVELSKAAHEGWGRGRPGEYVAFVETAALGRPDLVKARVYLDAAFAFAAGVAGEVKDDG
ncbi:MAG: radical SAM protein [Dehalococcoidia bacterium]|nr:radical SAM protein [Dehalococcoidia bacterium]